VPGYCIYVEAARREALVAAVQGSGAVPVSGEAIEAARIESGYPVFGIDMNEDTIPLEAGIESRAISFTKGCYVGQEIIIRVLHRGGGRVARRLVGLRAPDGPPQHGDKIFSGEREVGFVTSASESPRLGAIALGYVHRDFVAAGTTVEIDVDGQRRQATVNALPFERTDATPDAT
jgi:folate-binding protein YgfZ